MNTGETQNPVSKALREDQKQGREFIYNGYTIDLHDHDAHGTVDVGEEGIEVTNEVIEVGNGGIEVGDEGRTIVGQQGVTTPSDRRELAKPLNACEPPSTMDTMDMPDTLPSERPLLFSKIRFEAHRTRAVGVRPPRPVGPRPMKGQRSRPLPIPPLHSISSATVLCAADSNGFADEKIVHD